MAGGSCRPGPGPCSCQCPSLRACARYLAALPARAPVPLTCVSQFNFQRVPECQPVCSCLLWEVCSSQGPSLAGGGGGGCRQLLRGMVAAGGQSEAGVRLHLLHLSITYTHRLSHFHRFQISELASRKCICDPKISSRFHGHLQSGRDFEAPTCPSLASALNKSPPGLVSAVFSTFSSFLLAILLLQCPKHSAEVLGSVWSAARPPQGHPC